MFLNPNDHFVSLDAIKDKAELDLLHELAYADGGHVMINPTHIIWKRGEIVGGVSMGVLWAGTKPLIMEWFHPTKMMARDSMQIINIIVNTVKLLGHADGYMMIGPQSPFAPFLGRVGFQKISTVDIYHKFTQ